MNNYIGESLIKINHDIYTGLDKQKISAENCKYFLNHDF